MSIEHIYRILLEFMPLYAEEGDYYEKVPESLLVSHVQAENVDHIRAEATIAVIRRLLESLTLLDPVALKNEHWAFVSFPASLLARSLLETMATPDNTFFEPGYWKQGGYPPRKIEEEQRLLISRLEQQRTSVQNMVGVNPIRTVHVTWGVIRLGTKFLLHHREDKNRPEVANYVFPGGRLNPSEDLLIENQTPDALRDLFRINSNLAKKAQVRTLARELREELGLTQQEYTADFKRILNPFRKVEGARNNHAYTQYDIAIYSIKLTQAGELKVLDRVANGTGLWQWFTVSDLMDGKRPDGASPFVDALNRDDSIDTIQFLSDDIPDSSRNPPHFTTKNEAIELPRTAKGSVLTGESGKQRKLQLSLTQREWELLMLMGWVTRGLEIREFDEQMVVLGGGWVKMCNGDMLATARKLSGKFQSASFPLVECYTLGYCRLSIDAEHIYFQPDCFEYCWDYESDNKPVLLELKGIMTSWANLIGNHLEISLSPKVLKSMPAIEEGHDPDGNIETLEREFRRLIKPARAIGLRQLISKKDGLIEFIVPRTHF